MTININGRNAQGDALPKISLLHPNDRLTAACGNQSNLLDKVQQGRIPPAGGLDTHRHGWWTRHPQTAHELRTIRTISPISGTLPEVCPFLGAWAGSQRKRPHCACLARRGLAATQSTMAFLSYGNFLMIYTFLILHSRTCRLADLHRIRTISAFAKDEHQARAALAGLPLVFLSRTPRIGSQA